jgi:hypothetical protein
VVVAHVLDAEQLERTADLEHEQVARVGAAEHGGTAAGARRVGQRDEERRAGRVHERHAAHVDDEQLAAQAHDARGDLGETVALGEVEVPVDHERGRGG